MKHYTDEERKRITCALQSNDLAINAVRRLYGPDQPNENALKTEFRRDCERLGLGKIYKDKYHVGRKAVK